MRPEPHLSFHLLRYLDWQAETDVAFKPALSHILEGDRASSD